MSTVHHPWQKKVASYQRDARVDHHGGAHPRPAAVHQDKQRHHQAERRGVHATLQTLKDPNALPSRTRLWGAQEGVWAQESQHRRRTRLRARVTPLGQWLQGRRG